MEESTPSFQLRVLQGRTAFPERPLTEDRFLIGGGSQCQLQLGGDTPMIHSIITRHEDGWKIEAVTNWPLLMVNHQQVRRLVLRSDDVLEIGEFRFRLEQQTSEVVLPEPLPAPPAAEVLPIADEMAPDPAQLAAADLARRLEAALDELGKREARRKAGWNNLLTAAFAATAPEADGEPEVVVPESVPVEAPIAPWAHLEVALAELTERMNAMDAREAALIDNAQQLEGQQAELLECLDAIRAELSGQSATGPVPHLKISA